MATLTCPCNPCPLATDAAECPACGRPLGEDAEAGSAAVTVAALRQALRDWTADRLHYTGRCAEAEGAAAGLLARVADLEGRVGQLERLLGMRG